MREIPTAPTAPTARVCQRCGRPLACLAFATLAHAARTELPARALKAPTSDYLHARCATAVRAALTKQDNARVARRS